MTQRSRFDIAFRLISHFVCFLLLRVVKVDEGVENVTNLNLDSHSYLTSIGLRTTHRPFRTVLVQCTSGFSNSWRIRSLAADRIRWTTIDESVDVIWLFWAPAVRPLDSRHCIGRRGHCPNICQYAGDIQIYYVSLLTPSPLSLSNALPWRSD